MTLTAPIPVVQPAPHPPITVTARIALSTPSHAWRDVLIGWQARLELIILKRLLPTPWTILDGDTAWRIIPEPGKPSVLLEGVWRQR